MLMPLLKEVYRGKWIFCTRCEAPGRKLPWYEVFSILGGAVIAQIRYYGPWRRYALFPKQDTVWEERCLTDIAGFLKQLTEQRRKENRGTITSV